MRVGRIIGIPITLMVVVAGLGIAAPIAVPPETEGLVEGHTVFTVIEQVDARAENRSMYAAAVAVLVREVSVSTSSFRFPGVVWFNDQYLVNPESRPGSPTITYRYPCEGAVIAVQSGDPDPTADINATFANANYVESYQIRDPNDFNWVIDKWNVSGRFVWSVPIMNDNTRYNQTDRGTNCTPQGSRRVDSTCGGPTILPWEDEDQPSPGNDTTVASPDRRTSSPACSIPGFRPLPGSAPAPGHYNYPCGGKDSAPRLNCNALEYNALLYFLLEDLTIPGATKDHRDGSSDRARDASGCDSNMATGMPSSYTAWPCPGGDDEREGNSHAYNPERPYPLMTYAGRNNHGGSADCTGDGAGDQYCHATRLVDIYFGAANNPTTRYFRFTDTEGVTAPYHCHDHMRFCNQNDVFAAAGQKSP